MANALVVRKPAFAELKIKRAELRLKKKELERENIISVKNALLDVVDRGINVATPVLTSPVFALIAGYMFIDYAENKEWKGRPGDTMIGPAAAPLLRTALLTGFAVNAFGGASGVSNLVRAIR